MAKLDTGSLDSPSETRTFDKGKFDVVKLEGAIVGRFTFEPGWKWSECVKPIAGTDSCQSHHVGYAISGRIKVVMDDGTETEVGPGTAYIIPPGHDGWVVGNEPFVGLEFQSAETYARK
jgi:hypothetical protein